MAVRVVNLSIEQGTDFNNTFFLEDPVTNSQTNLAGTSAVAKLAKHQGSSTKTSFSVTITETKGTIGIALSSGITAGLKPGRYMSMMCYLQHLTDQKPEWLKKCSCYGRGLYLIEVSKCHLMQ